MIQALDTGPQDVGQHAPIPATPFGPRVEAVIGLGTGVFHLSRRVGGTLMSGILGIDISLGAVSAVEERVSEATNLPVDEAWAKTDEAAVKHTDGTSWYQAGVLCALWTIATSAVTVFKILTDGKATTLAPLFGKTLGILVSDRATALNFAVPTNILQVGSFRNQVAKSWHRALLRRSQRSRLDWSRMGRLINRWLPTVRIIHPWPDERFDVSTQGKSRVR